jgi:uncharacterized Ntn-hydrolase superfamily protein
MTFSIVARDPATGDLGVAVASKFLAVGSVVSHARAGVGGVATQALANYVYGPDALELLSGGLSASQALARLTEGDDGRDHRQAGIVDMAGGSATFTGSGCLDWAGGRTAPGIAAQGNILAGPDVVDVLIDTFIGSSVPFPERLVRALKAAEDAGGDRRGRQSAALLVVREGGGYGGNNDRWIDLRVDDHGDPINELGRLLELKHLYGDRPSPTELIPISDTIADELRRLLADAGFTPERLSGKPSLAELIESTGTERTGEPRDLPASWDARWESALAEWMSVENLEERMTARGWIDPRVLEHLRDRTRG